MDLPVSVKRAKRASFAFLAIFASAAASADTISDSFTIGLSTTDWYGPSAQSGSLMRFDGSLGTLTGVTFTFGGTIQSDVRLENLSRSSGTTAYTTVAGDFGMFESTSTLASLLTTASTSFTTGLGIGGVAIIPNVSASNSTSYSLSAALFSFVTGNTSLMFDITALDMSDSYDDNGNFSAGFNTLASAYGTVTYEFTPTVTATVPAPGAASAMLIGASALVRRRRARAKA